MKNKLPALCAVLLLLLALSVCGCGAAVSGSDDNSVSEPEELVLTDASGLEVTVQGSEISVSAPADETIGYAWDYTIRDERLISCTYNSLDDETADRKLQGFTFKAQRPGRTVIELTYAQAWSGGTIDTIRLLQCTVSDNLNITAEFL
jgi:hypothetical protein